MMVSCPKWATGLRLLTKGWAVPRHLICDGLVKCSQIGHALLLQIHTVLSYRLFGYLMYKLNATASPRSNLFYLVLAHCFGTSINCAFVKQMEHCNPTWRNDATWDGQHGDFLKLRSPQASTPSPACSLQDQHQVMWCFSYPQTG